MKDRYPGSESTEANQLAWRMHQMIQARLFAASEGEILSTRGHKIVRVMIEPDGSKFVSREYDPRSEFVGEDVLTHDQGFTNSWEQFTAIIEDAPFSLVPSSVIRDDSEGAHIISEYRETVTPLRDATLATRSAIVTYLTAGAVRKSDKRLHLATIEHDMFNVITLADGTETVELLDVDPYVFTQGPYQESTYSVETIKKLTNLIADMSKGWSRSEEERTHLAQAMVKEMIKYVPAEELTNISNLIALPFSVVHLLSNGVDPRN